MVQLFRPLGERTHTQGFVAAAALATLALVLSGCATDPMTSRQVRDDLTPTESLDELLRLEKVVNDIVGSGEWDDQRLWSWCSSVNNAENASYHVYLTRSGQHLSADPKIVASSVLKAIGDVGYEVRLQRDPTLSPPRHVIGYPRGYLQGTEPDGFGFLFTVGEDYASFNGFSRCVRETTPMPDPHPSPSPSPAAPAAEAEADEHAAADGDEDAEAADQPLGLAGEGVDEQWRREAEHDEREASDEEPRGAVGAFDHGSSLAAARSGRAGPKVGDLVARTRVLAPPAVGARVARAPPR